MAKYFTPFEFIRSETAKRLNIDNTPNEKQMDNIIEVMRIMDKIREKWTEYCTLNYLPNPQIIVTSGFRSEALNLAVKGSKTSQHKKGSAVDFKAKNGQNKALFEVILKMLESGEIKVRQLIWEKGDDNNPAWIHLGNYEEGKQENQILRL